VLVESRETESCVDPGSGQRLGWIGPSTGRTPVRVEFHPLDIGGKLVRPKFHAIAAALLVMTLSAGAAHAGGLIGLRAGVSVAEASFDIDQTFSSDNRTGFAATGFAQLGLGVILLQPEISYIQKGLDEVKLDYIELAVLAKAGLPIPVVSPHVFAGIGADFQTKSESDFVGLDTKNTDWTAIFGADVMFNLGAVTAVVDGRYGLGLTEIQSGTSPVSDLKNRAWLFSAGLAKQF
jgi:hypothetical protein